MSLQLNHLNWILDWALEKCCDAIEEFELEIIRHERFKDQPYLPRHRAEETRSERIERLQHRLVEYREIRDFLMKAKSEAGEKEAEVFAKWFKEHLRAQGKSWPTM